MMIHRIDRSKNVHLLDGKRNLAIGDDVHRRSTLKESVAEYRKLLLFQHDKAALKNRAGWLAGLTSRARAKRANRTGSAKFEQGKYQDAIIHYTQAIQLDHKFATAYLNRGLANFRLGRHRSAIIDLNRAISINPKYAMAFYVRGNVNSKLGKYKDAVRDYTKAIRYKPAFAAAYLNRGAANGELGWNLRPKGNPFRVTKIGKAEALYHRAAIRDYNKAIKLDPKNVRAYFNRGVALHFLHKYRAALRDYNKTIKLDPNNAMAHMHRGIARFVISKYVYEVMFAIKDFDRFLRLDPKCKLTVHKVNQCRIAYTNKGNARVVLQQYARAIQNYNKAIKIGSKNMRVVLYLYYRRGFAKLCFGKYAAAIKDFNRVVKAYPKMSKTYGFRAESKHRLKKYWGAIRDYTMAIKYDPKNPIYYEGRGKVKLKLGRHRSAAKDFSKAKSLRQKIKSP